MDLHNRLKTRKTDRELSLQHPPPKRSSSSSSSSSLSPLSIAWDVSEHVLRTLNSAAQCAPTPYLGILSVAALNIFNAVQGAKDNKDALNQLASTACNLVYTVSNSYNELHQAHVRVQLQEKSLPTPSLSIDPVLNKQVEGLVDTLREIHFFITNQGSRRLLRRVISSRSDLAVIQDSRDQLRQALDTFQLQSLITIRDTLSRLAYQQETRDQQAFSHHQTLMAVLLNTTSNQRQSEFGSTNQVFASAPSAVDEGPPISSTSLSLEPFAFFPSYCESVSLRL
ncbi:hypothetical protein BT96DRAFT_1032531 [Gymnopus androsaceus JB14]|uniref:Fungal N-terminal domain-containing protein n=1 Tax=Gymnopus androsaceus JB14 TaxID=1447944 RepID=A0A6A4HHC9_9AGAR|nr:hypothetical protein BT96DRAFT_1032531 [Gymnopus androsaceus JB14]